MSSRIRADIGLAVNSISDAPNSSVGVNFIERRARNRDIQVRIPASLA